jgi:hypothetical protein
MVRLILLLVCFSYAANVIEAEEQHDPSGWAIVAQIKKWPQAASSYGVEEEKISSPTSTPSHPIPTNTTSVYQNGVGSWRSLVCDTHYNWRCERAMRVLECESKGNPNATGALGEAGLFQLHPVHRPKAAGRSLYDPSVNVEVAHQIWMDQGWGPWSCKP